MAGLRVATLQARGVEDRIEAEQWQDERLLIVLIRRLSLWIGKGGEYSVMAVATAVVVAVVAPVAEGPNRSFNGHVTVAKAGVNRSRSRITHLEHAQVVLEPIRVRAHSIDARRVRPLSPPAVTRSGRRRILSSGAGGDP